MGRSKAEDGFVPDAWQRQVLEHDGNLHIRNGRQTGKSTVVAKRVSRFALEHTKSIILISGASKRQAAWLFEKIRIELQEGERKGGMGFAEQPTLEKLVLENGAQLFLVPLGRTGFFARGLPIDLLVVDEAAYVPETVWNSILPSIATGQGKGLGWIYMCSTPFGKGGYFWEAESDPDFLHVHVSSEQCSRIPRDFLAKERARMSREQYAQEYLGEYIDDLRQLFPTPLIKQCMSIVEWDFESNYDAGKKYYLGVDIARYGEDENAFVIAEMDRRHVIRIVKALTTSRISLMDTVGRIKMLDNKFRFRKVFIDDAGVGGGVYDALEEEYGRRLVGLNNATRSLDEDAKIRRRILKEDLYSNALVLMEAGKLEIISDLQLQKSLKSIIFEYTADKALKISGNYTHLAEAFIRACWCIKDPGLSLFLA
jgi:hypothetical protein